MLVDYHCEYDVPTIYCIVLNVAVEMGLIHFSVRYFEMVCFYCEYHVPDDVESISYRYRIHQKSSKPKEIKNLQEHGL